MLFGTVVIVASIAQPIVAQTIVVGFTLLAMFN